MSKGRPKSMDYTPEQFHELSKEERQLRMKLSELKEKIKRREGKLKELMNPIHRLQNEIDSFRKEMDELKNSIKDMGFDFPTFRTETFMTKDNPYWRGVWYVNGKKKQKYLGTEKKVFSLVGSTVEGFDNLSIKQKEELIRDYYLPELQLEYWKKQPSELERRQKEKDDEYVKNLESQDSVSSFEWVEYMSEYGD
jgi:uncharacterized protein (UPF0335 family)